MSSDFRRVVITGVGLVSPLGNSKQALWEALRNGRSGVGPIQCLPAGALPIRCAAEAREFSGKIEDFGELASDQKRTIRKGLKVMCREIQMGVAAAQLALQDAGLKTGVYDVDRTGAVYGSDYIMTEPEEFTEGVRSCLTEERQFDFSRWAVDGLPKVTPLWLLKYLPNMPASHIAIYNDLRGPNNSVTLREASSNLAVSEAYCTIVRGNADIMLAGATGTRLHPLRTVHVTMQEEVAAGDGPPEQVSRPFDLNRRGMVLGEGAGAIVLEELRSAESRGVEILGEVVGYGSSAVMNRDGKGDIKQALSNVIVQVLRKAGVNPQNVGHIHAHGLSTRLDDAHEAAALNGIFGTEGRCVPVTAAKSYMGNLGAAGGLVELIASLLAMQHGQLFPVLNFETPDPDCPITVVRDGDTLPGDSFLNLSVTP
ncbi:MAG: beta-ketoacyl-[acyl-carrier-protein] synthase family protein, partial [Planctomycetes bacterium]|nr:beta-ketoacyl-[acyl-carrier-protein] synthase family protein [Planctomycetota bacterium]